jgi:type 1 glutamine amidotransferase
MKLRRVILPIALLLTVTLTALAEPQAPAAEGAARGQSAPAGERGRGRGRGPADPFAGQPRVNALVVSGGCCHDYALQGRLLMDAVNRALPVDWTVTVQGGRGTSGTMPVYARPDWAKGFDLVIHNECLANVDDPQYIRNITAAHRGGPPAVVIHCAMHSYRAATIDDWREFLGVTSRTHTKPFPIPVKVAAMGHPAMKGFREDWVTPIDELYVIEKVWPGTTPLATAVSPEDKKEYPLAWAGEYGGTRVFGTTLGHGNETWADPVFQDLLTRGVRWALKRD